MENKITWSNKDFVSKVLSDTFAEKSFSVYGIDLPPIAEFLPAELPTIEATDRVADRLFHLKDDSYALVDFESVYKKRNKIKYLHYITRVLDRYMKEKKSFRLRFLVIYTGDVRSADAGFSTDCVTVRTEQVFLSHIDGKAEHQKIQRKMEYGDTLSDEDLMMLTILPLTFRGNKQKLAMLDKVIAIAERVEKEEQRVFVLAAIAVANNKFITQEQLNRIEEVLRMTRLSQQIFDKWKADTLSYGDKQRQEGRKEGKEEGKILGTVETMRDDGKDDQAILSRLASKYDLTEKQAKNYLHIATKQEA